ncbi:MAG: hypothetical protein ACLUSV_07180 [Streptococcus sp.]
MAGNPMKTTASDDTKQRAPYDIRYDGDYIYSSFVQATTWTCLTCKGNCIGASLTLYYLDCQRVRS